MFKLSNATSYPKQNKEQRDSFLADAATTRSVLYATNQVARLTKHLAPGTQLKSGNTFDPMLRVDSLIQVGITMSSFMGKKV